MYVRLTVSRIAWIAWGLCTFGTISGVALAEPMVRVRAETRIELRIRRGVDGLTVEGRLRDELGTALSGRNVSLWLGANGGAGERSETRITGIDGAFNASWFLPRGSYDVRASFGGDAYHVGTEARRPIELDKVDVELQVRAPEGAVFDLEREEHRIHVIAKSDVGGGDLFMELRDESNRKLASGRTDVTGELWMSVVSAALGPPGAGRFKVRSNGDATRAGAQTEIPIVRARRTHLVLHAAHRDVTTDEDVALSGKLFDSAGPLEGQAVGLYAEDRHIATVLTGTDGSFSRSFDANELRAGHMRLVARYEGDTPGRLASVSAPVLLRIRSAGASQWPWLLLPTLVCAGILVLAGRRTRHERSAVTPIRKPRPGIVTGARQGRKPTYFDVSGTAVDHRGDVSIAGARAAITDTTNAPMLVESGPDGRFDHPNLRAGTWKLRIEADGYEPIESEVSIPHHGEWSNVKVRMQSLRALAVAPYRRVAVASLGSTKPWPLLTNQEIIERLREQGRPVTLLSRLSQRVDAAAYGKEAPNHDEIAAIDADARQASKELGPSAEARAGGPTPR